MSAARIVIVGCGAAKRPDAAPASSLYTGQHFRLALAAALAIAPRDRVFILSAKYGLVTLDQTISPYDLTIGEPGAVTSDEVALQASALHVLASRVVVLASARYADVARAAWGERFVSAPLAGQGIGSQRGTLAGIRDGRVSVDDPAPAERCRETDACLCPDCYRRKFGTNPPDAA